MTETAADRSSASAHSSPPSTRSRPWTYAARPDSEAALHGLVARLRSGETRIALEGPPASGKTLLLHVLPERLGSAFATAYIPHPGLDPAGVRAWLESFGEPLPADAGSTFEDLAFAYARRGAGLVLLIDDANSMPQVVAGAFAGVLARTGDALRIVVAGVSDANLDATVEALGGRASRVRLGATHDQPEPRDAGAPLALPTPPPPPIAAARQAARPPAPLPSSAAGEPGRPAARTPRSARAQTRHSRLRPSRAALLAPLRATAIAGVVLIAAATLVLVCSDTRDELPGVSAAPPPTPTTVASETVPVHVNARPWARIFVDDRELGPTPLGNVPIALGMRRFRAELADGRIVEREVRVEAADQRVTFP